jgi:hypothetical protein
VIFGSNISSTVNYPPYPRKRLSSKAYGKIPLNLKPVILGLIFSDAFLIINKTGKSLLYFKQSTDKLELIFSLPRVFN